VVIWYIFPRFGTLYQEKSGNPAVESILWIGLGRKQIGQILPLMLDTFSFKNGNQMSI
jgi:hypothetical protein